MLLWTAAAAAADGCHRECGNVSVPYPFGLGHPNCSKHPGFNLTCNDSLFPPVLYYSSIPILNISVEEATATVNIPTTFDCYNQSGGTDNFTQNFNLKGSQFTFSATRTINLTGSQFTFSATQNKFTAIGCNAIAVIYGSEDHPDMSGCMSLCNRPVNVASEGSCSGKGCCQTQIPKGTQFLRMLLSGVDNYSGLLGFNPCSYAFLANHNWLNFSNIKLSVLPKEFQNSQVVLDWVVDNQSCEAAIKNRSSYGCAPNSDCLDYSDNYGYRCKCKEGYQGNPYLLNKGCQDIDECSEPTLYPCHGTCKNTTRNYTCRCPLGMRGDGQQGCRGLRLTVLVTVIVGITASATIVFRAYRQFEKRREKYFQQNGGLFLMNQRVRIFKEAELKKATTNYNENIGHGATGVVYKGILTESTEVAVKKSKEVDNNQFKQYLDEVQLVSQVNHRNVVKLLGLCLETKVPLLVYEFVSNGTLSKHTHDHGPTILNFWQNRLRIAAETAQALDYLHSFANPPIIHRDIKSTNIVLDERYTAKISDFGASVLIPLGQTGKRTRVMGTWGYLDPEYLQTGTLTTKSDVYSFGVVLMELLTRIKPYSDAEGGRNVIQEFISSYKEEGLMRILNVGDVNQNEMNQIKAVAKITYGCLKRSGIERPTMREVADELIGLMHENPGAGQRNEETERLLGEPESYVADQSGSEGQFMTALSIEVGSSYGM